MCVKGEKEDIIKRSERVRERHKNGTARAVVFERETTARRRTRNRIVFTPSFQKFKRERRTSPTPRHHHHHHHRDTNARSKQRERERKNTRITEYLETG